MRPTIGPAQLSLCGLILLLVSIDVVSAQQLSIELFDATLTFASGSVTSPADALPTASTSLVLRLGPLDRAVLSSTPDGTGSIVIDNFMTINGVNACALVAGRDSCFGPIIDPDLPIGVPIETVLTPVAPIEVTALIPVGTTTVLFELRDFGVIRGNTDLFLVTVGVNLGLPFECSDSSSDCTCSGYFDCNALRKSGCCRTPIDTCRTPTDGPETCSCSKSRKCS